jgi:hypothetical protein
VTPNPAIRADRSKRVSRACGFLFAVLLGGGSARMTFRSNLLRAKTALAMRGRGASAWRMPPHERTPVLYKRGMAHGSTHTVE